MNLQTPQQKALFVDVGPAHDNDQDTTFIFHPVNDDAATLQIYGLLPYLKHLYGRPALDFFEGQYAVDQDCLKWDAKQHKAIDPEDVANDKCMAD